MKSNQDVSTLSSTEEKQEKQQKNKKNKIANDFVCFPIYNREIALRAYQKGHDLIAFRPNRRNSQDTVFLFRDTPELHQFMQAEKEESEKYKLQEAGRNDNKTDN